MTTPEPPQDHEGTPPDPSNTNQTTGSMSGVQAGTINGDVDITMADARPGKAELVTLWLTTDEIADLKEQFVPTVQFDRAYNVLRDNPVVVLCGADTGRTFTGRKLLLQHGHGDIAHLNSARSLATIEKTELRKGAGYLWRASDIGCPAFPNSDVDQAAHIMRSMECRLAIIIDDESRVPHEARNHTVKLSPPNATAVSRAIIRRQDDKVQDRALEVVHSGFATALNDDDPPWKAVRAAELAVSVANGNLEVAAALEMLTENIDKTIATAYKGWSVLEFSMMLAIAVLENKPFDEVADHALRLDELIRTAELPPDLKLGPRHVFAKSKDRLLRDVRAKTDLRDHPQHAGLREETVRFDRHDWAEAVVCHIWREYLTVHPLLLEWMCSSQLLSRFPAACVNVLCLVTSRIPAHEPLRMIDLLAAADRLSYRKLASWTLVDLADVHDLQPVVDETLDLWVQEGSASRKATAAMTYALRLSKTDPRTALDKMAAITGKSTAYRVHNTVVHSMLFMVKDAPDNRWIVLDAMRKWTDTVNKDKKYNGPRQVALTVGMWAIGLKPNLDELYVEARVLIPDHTAEVRFLAEKILWDHEYGQTALNHLFTLANAAYYEAPGTTSDEAEPAGAKLVRILSLLTPDLRWWHRLPTVLRLGRRHPSRRKQIRWIFTMARAHQRARS